MCENDKRTQRGVRKTNMCLGQPLKLFLEKKKKTTLIIIEF